MTGRIFVSLTPTRDGLALGAGTIVVKRDADGGLAIDGHEDEIIALLSSAHGRLMPPSILGSIRAAAKAYPALTDADFEQLRHPRFAERLLLPPDAPPPPLLRVTLALALGGVPSLHATGDAEKAGRYLVQAKNRLATLSPIDLLKAQGILPKNATAILQKAYNPNQPRVPAGNGRPSGRWTGEGAIDALSELLETLNPISEAHAQEVEPDEENRDDPVESDAIRTDQFRSALATLAQLDPKNPQLTYVTEPGWIPTQADIQQVQAEIARISNQRTDAIEALLMPNGNAIGVCRPRSDTRFRTLPGGEAGAEQMFQILTQGMIENIPSTYPPDGVAFTLPNGAFIGYRPVSSENGPPTIDIKIPGLKGLLEKLKFPEDWDDQ